MTTVLKEAHTSKLETLVQQVKPQWREEFRHFVETGDASDEFLDYLDHSKEGKQAVEMAFKAQADALTGLADALKNLQTESSVAQPAQSADAASAKVAQAVEGLLQLPPEEEELAVEKAASVLSTTLGQEGQSRLRTVARKLGKALAKAAAVNE